MYMINKKRQMNFYLIAFAVAAIAAVVYYMNKRGDGGSGSGGGDGQTCNKRVMYVNDQGLKAVQKAARAPLCNTKTYLKSEASGCRSCDENKLAMLQKADFKETKFVPDEYGFMYPKPMYKNADPFTSGTENVDFADPVNDVQVPGWSSIAYRPDKNDINERYMRAQF
jgi:hypothetical protein